uniref:Uncharacterized protein n=1 Tax=Anguilla anguilla TaxID=7936 RepID=A0A0E9VJY7_ANGAN
MYILTVIQSDGKSHYVLMVEGSPKPKGGQSKEQGIHESVKCLLWTSRCQEGPCSHRVTLKSPPEGGKCILR